jgi:hypothetical protein
MARAQFSQSSFARRHNQDGTVDSICKRCFMTVAQVEDESELQRLKQSTSVPQENLAQSWLSRRNVDLDGVDRFHCWFPVRPQLRIAQDFVNIAGSESAEQVMGMRPDEQILLGGGKEMRCKQARYYNDELFRRVPE